MNSATNGAAHFFLQLAVILSVCAVMRVVMRRVGQTPVIGEMIAGVLLGPSLFGLLWPDAASFVFPAASKPILYSVASLGLTLYMFVVGLEFRSDLFREKLRTALAVSSAGILAPFILGGGVAYWLQSEGGFFAPHVSDSIAWLFIGAALSITAFPMLARIIREHGLSGTLVGTIALAAGSFDDVVAWMLLAVVLGCISGKPMLALYAIGGSLVYVLTCLFVVKPALWKFHRRFKNESELFSLVMLFVVLGAFFTDLVGLYSVFGAFILGLSVPRDGLADKLAAKVDPLTTAVLLPVFFTYSGLNTRIGLLDSLWLWVICGVIIVVSISAKLFACYGAARLSGIKHSDSLTIASLMNARGLMELILLNIGLQAGLITQTLFTMLVLMAVVTTLMAAPGFHAACKLSSENC
ncbi:cation:proton antiporter [bacterium]|nr:cation:proton antiporter [bacterium]